MVPDKFNMVDMGGIDLIMMQGEEVPGLYNRLVESIAQCRYQCLYNWMFDGVIIPPTYVELEVNENDEVAINEGVVVTEDDVIHIYSIEHPIEPVTIPLLAEENGTYNVPEGVDGFQPVTVDVPSYTPVIQPLSVTENGTYTAPSGTDGYSPVTVDVPSDTPVIQSLSVTENGTYTAPSGVDGYSPISVNVSGGGAEKLHLHLGRLAINTGVITESSEYCYSDMIPISTGSGFWYLDLTRSDQNSYYIGICFYAEDMTTVPTYIRQYENYRSYGASAGSARYFRIATKVANLSYANVTFASGGIFIGSSSGAVYQNELES